MTTISAAPIKIGGQYYSLSAPPRRTTYREDLGLILADGLDGVVMHRGEAPHNRAYEVRAIITPNGDYLAAICAGSAHFNGQKTKVNDLIAYRSKDKGKTWTGGKPLWDVPYNQHGFLPLIPHGSKRIYSFGTEPHPDHFEGPENAAIAFRYSDDDGCTWNGPHFIRPTNDPDFQGISVIRPCQTDRGTIILSSYPAGRNIVNTGENGKLAEGESRVTVTSRQYFLRSEDLGETWEVVPGKRPGGWNIPRYQRLDESHPVSLGNGEVYALCRTQDGRLWEMRSLDDGKTWTGPNPTALVHPDAPAMLFKLSDGKTLAAFHHNRHTGGHFNHPDRSELWVSLSKDGGRSWAEPRFIAANNGVCSEQWNMQISNLAYVDLLLDGGKALLFIPQRFAQTTRLWFPEEIFYRLPTRAELA
jgi:BNR repeat-like domain